MAEDPQLNSALNLMRRMPPAGCENSLAGLIELVPQLTEDLLNHVDQPLKVLTDTSNGKPFILCDYNRDGDSHRSPWSNSYFPAAEGFTPPARLRQQEEQANLLLNVYRKQYFDGGVSSAYFFETDEKSQTDFGACFLIHKDVPGTKSLKAGFWDSVHVFDVQPSKKAGHFLYKLTTTVILSMNLHDEGKIGNVDLSGHMTKQVEVEKKMDGKADTHLSNMGTMLETADSDVRKSLDVIYVQKTKDVINGIRNTDDAVSRESNAKNWGDINKGLQARAGAKQ